MASIADILIGGLMDRSEGVIGKFEEIGRKKWGNVKVRVVCIIGILRWIGI